MGVGCKVTPGSLCVIHADGGQACGGSESGVVVVGDGPRPPVTPVTCHCWCHWW